MYRYNHKERYGLNIADLILAIHNKGIQYPRYLLCGHSISKNSTILDYNFSGVCKRNVEEMSQLHWSCKKIFNTCHITNQEYNFLSLDSFYCILVER